MAPRKPPVKPVVPITPWNPAQSVEDNTPRPSPSSGGKPAPR
jgi:hypothetical protein